MTSPSTCTSPGTACIALGTSSSDGTDAIQVDQPICSFGYFQRKLCGKRLTSTEIQHVNAPGGGRYCSNCVQRIVLRRQQKNNSARKRRADSKTDVTTKRCSTCCVLANTLLQEGVSFRPDFKTCDRCLQQQAAKRRRLSSTKATAVTVAATSSTTDIDTSATGSESASDASDESKSASTPVRAPNGTARRLHPLEMAAGTMSASGSEVGRTPSTSEVAGTVDDPSTSISSSVPLATRDIFDGTVTPHRTADIHETHRGQIADLPSSAFVMTKDHRSTGKRIVKSPPVPVTHARLFHATSSLTKVHQAAIRCSMSI